MLVMQCLECAIVKFKLLNIDANPKTVKGRRKGYMTAILYMSSYKASGVNLCALAEKAGCIDDCLTTSGHGGIASKTFETPGGIQLPDNSVQHARLRKALWFVNDLQSFMDQLVAEIRAFVAMARKLGLIPVVRLNGTTDIRWEDIPVDGKANIFAVFPRIQFYDYTKIPNRRRALLVKNYSLTFSYSHRPEFAPIVAQAIRNYGDKVNMAVVFKGQLPEFFLGRPVINADDSDLRFLDKAGTVSGLKAKGKARKSMSGFTVPADYVGADVMPAFEIAA